MADDFCAACGGTTKNWKIELNGCELAEKLRKVFCCLWLKPLFLDDWKVEEFKVLKLASF